MRRFMILRRFIGIEPPKPTKLTEAEVEILRKTTKFEEELERKDWAQHFNSDSDADNYQVPEVTKPEAQVPAEVQDSSEEDVVPFFIDDLKQVQYVYKPKNTLVFDESGYAVIYRKQRRWLTLEKFRYCKNLAWAYFLSAYFFLNHVYFGVEAPFLALVVPPLILSRALLTDSIKINKAGTQLKVESRRCRWLWSKERVINIKDFDEPKGLKFGLWNVYEFPDDLKTYAENEQLVKYGFAKKLPGSRWSFLLMPSQPEEVNREVLINSLNGIFIDTECGGSEELEKRYVVLDRKDLAEQ